LYLPDAHQLSFTYASIAFHRADARTTWLSTSTAVAVKKSNIDPIQYFQIRFEVSAQLKPCMTLADSADGIGSREMIGLLMDFLKESTGGRSH
jgi:hypothetical protein